MASRSRRRARGGGSGRSRRTPVRAAGGRNLPWVPVVVIAVIVAAIAGVAFLVLQAQSGGGGFDEAVAAEADVDPNLPGQFVDLPKAYGGPYPDTAGHVTRQIDYASDCSDTEPKVCNTNPPAGGPHWSGNCGEDPTTAPAFCGPARLGVYRDPWEPETLVHNMEHGGVVIWYNTTDQQVIDDLEGLVGERLNDGKLLVMAPYPDMEPDTIALTAWSRLDTFSVAEYTNERVDSFINAHVRQFNPEHF